MKTIEEFYEKRLIDFMHKNVNPKSNTIMFFQGFPENFYCVLTNSDINRLCLLHSHGYIDYRTIDSSKLLQDFLGSTGVCWGYYEELIELTEVVHKNLCKVGKSG